MDNFVPQPENRSDRFGTSAYDASNNFATNTNGAGIGPLADVSLALGSTLTSRTGGRFRATGSISGTCTAADVITCTMEVNINGGGLVAIATQLLMGAGEGARFGATFNVLTAAVAVGGTITGTIRAVDATNPTATIAAGQATIALQELPG